MFYGNSLILWPTVCAAIVISVDYDQYSAKYYLINLPLKPKFNASWIPVQMGF